MSLLILRPRRHDNTRSISMWPWLSFLFSSSLADVCYNDVFLHRINAFLPSSGPFCLAGYWDKEYSQPVLNDDQIAKLLRGEAPVEKNPILYRYQSEFILPVQLPASFLGDLCTSYQTIEIGRNLTSECSLVVNQNNCPAFSPQNLFGNLVTIQDNQTYSLPMELINGTEMLSTSWRDGACHNLFHEAELRLLMNGSLLAAGSLQLKYSSPTAGRFSQKYVIVFVDREDGLQPEEKIDDRIHAVQAGRTGPLRFPSLGPCDGNRTTEIRFKQFMSTGCMFRVTSCEDATTKLRGFIARYLPTHIVATPESELVPIVNVDSSQAAFSDCVLPITFNLDIFYAKFGKTTEFREFPVGMHSIQDYAGVNIRGEFDLVIRVAVRFIDTTSDPTPYFSGLPYIDLRLPAEAFYPFVRSPSSTKLTPLFTCLLIIYLSF